MSSPNQVPQYSRNINNHQFSQAAQNQNLQQVQPHNQSNTEFVSDELSDLFDWETCMEEALSVHEFDRISTYLKMRMFYVPVMDIDLHHEHQDPREPETCAICIFEYQNGDIIGKLQCEHEFHVDCIKKWLLRQKVCPLCRGSVVPAP